MMQTPPEARFWRRALGLGRVLTGAHTIGGLGVGAGAGAEEGGGIGDVGLR